MIQLINEYGGLLLEGTRDTLYMTFLSALFAYIIGMPLGILLVISEDKHILPAPALHHTLGTIINVLRSVPFIILLIAVIPFTRMVVGTTIGATASVVPLVIGAIPFVARLVEGSLKELKKGIVEAALAMGASPLQIITRVMIPESMPSLVHGATLTTITLIGYSAMAGAVGGGGLGDIAIRYGYYRYEESIMFVTIVLLVVIVQLIQWGGNRLARKIKKH